MSGARRWTLSLHRRKSAAAKAMWARRFGWRDPGLAAGALSEMG